MIIYIRGFDIMDTERRMQMLSQQKIQNILMEMKEITQRELALFSENGHRFAATGLVTEDMEEVADKFMLSQAESQTYHNCTYFKILMDGETEYVLMIEGEDEYVMVIGRLIACQMRHLAESLEEQYDRNHFIQNLLLGNLLSADIYMQAKRLHISPAKRVVFVIDTGGKPNDVVLDLVRNLSDIQSGDFVTNIDEHDVILVKDVSHVSDERLESRLQEVASRLADNLHMEAMIRVRVGYGNPVEQINELTGSYQEARMALSVAKEFYAEYDTISYGKLGIGRLIYQLPMSLCEMYIREVFGDKIPDVLDDEESMSTISIFFQNNLNISETARQLYVHRNTLVYRLERIEKSIGLDIRKFDDAMTFRIAVMVLSHMRQQ